MDFLDEKLVSVIEAMGDAVSIQDKDFRVLFQNRIHRSYVGEGP